MGIHEREMGGGDKNGREGEGSLIPMPSTPSSTWDLMIFAEGTKTPEVVEHGQLGLVEVEARPTVASKARPTNVIPSTPSCCRLCWHMGGA